METLRLISMRGGLVVVEITIETDAPFRLRRIFASNLSDRTLVGFARNVQGTWERYDLSPDTVVDRNIPGNRRVPIADLTWHAAVA